MKMTTDPFQDDLKAYADGELPWLRRLAVRRHLTHCASCQEELTTMTQIAEDMRASETEDTLPADLRAKILAATGEEAHSSPVPPELEARGRTRPALGWAIAGVALIGWFVGFPLYQNNLGNAMHKDRVVGSAAVEQRVMPLKYQQYAADSDSASPSAPAALGGRTDRRYIMPRVKPSGQKAGAGQASPVQFQNGNYKSEVLFGNSSAPGGASPGPMALPKSPPEVSDVAGDSLRQVHKEASIGVQVPNPETTSDTVENMVTETGGYVAANNLSTGDDGMKTAELIVKVPVAQFETFLGQVAKLGNVQSKNITGEDITEKTSDADQEENVLEEDVQNSETRLKALGSTAKWHDEETTRELRVQLAQSRARLVLLKRMAALGTLTIDLSQMPKAVLAPPVTGGFLSGLKGNTHDALQSLMNSASALLALVIWLLAYSPIWIPLLLIGRYARRKYEAGQAKAG